ncbi:MAG: hypothetical protein QOH91_898 [Mycobacterium sp.]|nr:hypothetical protein [Mycobacterium sp.]
MLVALFNAVKVESVPLNFNEFSRGSDTPGRTACVRRPNRVAPSSLRWWHRACVQLSVRPRLRALSTVSIRPRPAPWPRHCVSLSVSGNGNHVTIDSTDAVSTTGVGNVITDHPGSSKIVDAGTSNTVQLAEQSGKKPSPVQRSGTPVARIRPVRRGRRTAVHGCRRSRRGRSSRRSREPVSAALARGPGSATVLGVTVGRGR